VLLAVEVTSLREDVRGLGYVCVMTASAVWVLGIATLLTKLGLRLSLTTHDGSVRAVKVVIARVVGCACEGVCGIAVAGSSVLDGTEGG
jgi:hypothetical protein